MNSHLTKVLKGILVSQCGQRTFTSGSNASGAAVKLSFDKYDVKRDSGETGSPLLIMHGLFGSRQNWRAISKRLNADLNPYRAVYAIDARNHGLSPKNPEHNYDLMAADLKELYRHLGINKATIMGHSMGGRTMINFALKYPELVDKAIIVDITQYNSASNLEQIAEMLQVLRDLKLDSGVSLSDGRRAASELLANIGVNQATRDFVLLNLIKNAQNAFEWRIDIESLKANLQNVLLFPQKSLNKKFVGETLFIGGANSNYIEKKDTGKIKINFPKAQFEFIERAGHLVHVEQPAKFIEVVSGFLNAK